MLDERVDGRLFAPGSLGRTSGGEIIVMAFLIDFYTREPAKDRAALYRESVQGTFQMRQPPKREPK